MKIPYLMSICLLLSACSKEEQPVEDTNPFNNLNLCDSSGFPEQVGICQLKTVEYRGTFKATAKDSFIYDEKQRLIEEYYIYGLDLMPYYYSYEYDESCSVISVYTRMLSSDIKNIHRKEIYNNKQLVYRGHFGSDGNLTSEHAFQYQNGRLSGCHYKSKGGMLYYEINLDPEGNVVQVIPRQIDGNVPVSNKASNYIYSSVLNPFHYLPVLVICTSLAPMHMKLAIRKRAKLWPTIKIIYPSGLTA